MNVLLKAFVKEASDLEKAILDGVHHEGTTKIIGDVSQAAMDLGTILFNIGDLQTELATLLVNPQADADLFSYAMECFGHNESKAQIAVVSAAKNSLNLASVVTAHIFNKS